MSKHFLLVLLLGVTQLATSCHTDVDAEVRPANYDALALATGHWEWDRSTYMSGNKTPATLGFTRQAVFGANGQLTVRRSGQADYHTSYQLSMGISKYCAGTSNVPLITYTSEPDLGNNDTKLYTIDQRSGQQLLTITGEAACVDGGAYETYHWVAE